MRVIFIMADTFRYDHLGVNGNKWIHTPSLDRLAAMSSVFDQKYIGSFPTLPNRRDIHLGTGGKDAPLNSWMGFEDDETPLAETLSGAGIPTTMISDVANSFMQTRTVFNGQDLKNINRGFDFYLGNRGQEGDNWLLDGEVPLEFDVDPKLIRYPASGWHRVLMNRARRFVEDDWYAPQTYKMACEWLERNWRRDNFFLWIETFDPHEPWDPPQYYIDRYDPGYTGRVFEAPPYGYYKEMGITDREVKHIQARYAAECTMVDACVGRLLATLDRLNMLEDTAIIFTSDHGAYFGYEGDNGLIGKHNICNQDGTLFAGGQTPKDPLRLSPQYTGVCHIPLFIHMPGQSSMKRYAQIVQPWDLAPTILDLYGLAPSDRHVLGQSLMPLLNGKKKATRKAAIAGSAPYNIQAMNDQWIYTLFLRPKSDKGTVQKPWLIDLKNDPRQKKNVARQHPDVCQAMFKEIEAFVKKQPNVPDSFLDGLVRE